jgi:hypothetical protein
MSRYRRARTVQVVRERRDQIEMQYCSKGYEGSLEGSTVYQMVMRVWQLGVRWRG